MKNKNRVDAFSLIEISIVLIVVGLVTGAVFKGKDILENAKIRAVASDFQQYDLAVNNYHETYHALPGDDPKASMHFNGVNSGDGDWQIEAQEAEMFWQHLSKASLINFDSAPTSKMGGKFSVVNNPYSDMPGNWLMLSKDGYGLLTPAQAQKLKKATEQGNNTTKASEGQMVIRDGKNANGRCVVDDKINLESRTPDCVVYYRL